MPNNRTQAVKRAEWQRKKMSRSEQYYNDYHAFIQNLFDKGYAEPVTADQLHAAPGKVWYLPHHGIYNPNKPGKIRVVFDCGAKHAGISLNDRLLQGPDLANNLVGVLTRFRLDHTAFSGDIESMFYRVNVPEHQRNFLRFLWWPNGDLQQNLAEYQMSVHIFGAVSSPSVANYVLRLIGTQAANPQVTNTIHRNFYVDDCLQAVSTTNEAISLIHNLRKTCLDGGFRLTKFLCNSNDVTASIPPNEHAKELQSRELYSDPLPVTKTLGVQWNVEDDQFGFSIRIRDKPLIRRGILAMVSSLYDPLGLVAPVVLQAKRILQDLCKETELGWDVEVPEAFIPRWRQWLSALPGLENLVINRCFKPMDFGPVITRQLHVFADASSNGYGAVVYLRLTNDKDEHAVSFVAGKSRLAPLKSTTIPRLELTAAVTAVRLGCMMQREMDEPLVVKFYTDSSTVLRYIANDRQRYPIFIANRIQVIRDFSQTSQWNHIASELNPADTASRGLTVDELVNSSNWIHGPAFLAQSEERWPDGVSKRFISDEQPEHVPETGADQVGCHAAVIEPDDSTERLLAYFSKWYKLLKAVAVYRKVTSMLQDRVRHKRTQQPERVSDTNYRINAQDIEKAELAVFRYLHRIVYADTVKHLQLMTTPQGSERSRVRRISRSSPLYKLSPYLEDGLLRVGGRLTRALIPDDMKHPIILPRNHHITTLVIRGTHEKLGHAGRNHVLSELRNKFWIVRGNSAVRHVLYNCVQCRRMRGSVQEQKMADLPSCRVGDTPPFYNTGVDYFGPFVVKCGRKDVKRYGVLFTCLSSRAVHLEVADSLESDTFINVLRRFIARRGHIRSLFSDNGTNFVGADRELRNALSEMDQEKVKETLLCRGIDWSFNPPSASHMGGVWERMIRSVRKILSGLLCEYGTRLDTDSLHTFLCEVEAIMNSRPITTVSGDSSDLEPLTPNHLLTGKSVVTAPPPGVFQRNDIYMRRRWRRVQYLTNVFWSRWRNEYLLMLQPRQKWSEQRRNLQIGDVVLIKDDCCPRCDWLLGLVEVTEKDQSGDVRAVTVKTQHSCFRRPVSKLVLLVPIGK